MSTKRLSVPYSVVVAFAGLLAAAAATSGSPSAGAQAAAAPQTATTPGAAPRRQPAAPATPATALPPKVVAIEAPASPLPSEAESAGIDQFSFIVYGDTRGRRDGKDLQYEHSLIVDEMLLAIERATKTPWPVRFVLQSGDAVVNGRDAAQWNRSFIDLINRLTRDGGVPYFLAPGNHDVTSSGDLLSPGRREGLDNYLAAVARLIPPDGAARRLSGYPTYAFGYGNLFVLALDSNIAADDVQFAWVTSQLAGLDRKRFPHVVAFFHHPGFSSGPHGGPRVEPQAAAVRERYLPLFREHHVTMTVAGHEHLFEHWVERYTSADGLQRQIDHVVTGGGGAPLYAFSGLPDLTAYVKANASQNVTLEQVARPGPKRGDNPYHFAVVRVNGDQWDIEVIGVDWGRNFAPYHSNRRQLTTPAGGTDR